MSRVDPTDTKGFTMIKQFTNLSGIRTEVLFIQARQMHMISLLSSLLGAFIIAIMLVSFKTVDSRIIYFCILAVAFLFFSAFLAYWHLNKNVLPELQKRCSELPSKIVNEDYVAKYKKQRKWSIFGTLLLFLAVCLYVVLQHIGFIKPNTHSFQLEPIHLIVIIVLIIPALIFFLLRIRCPACKRFIPKQYENKQGTCPHCGVKLK